MDYNSSRSQLRMPEYGRNVQSMVEYLLTIDDRQKRLRNAEVIIELMATLTPHLKTIEDYKHKLWDHLYQMTDFKLDVDSPYPPPTREEAFKKPEMIPYPEQHAKHRHFGRNFDTLLKRAMEEPDPERRQGFAQTLGYYMKLAYTNWHREPVHDDMIKNELAVLSNGILRYEPGGFRVQFDPRAGSSGSSFRINNRSSSSPNNRNNRGGSGSSNGNRPGQGGGHNNGGGGSNNGGNNRNRNNRNFRKK